MSRIGRFISQDPSGSGNNWYEYARNNPIHNTDPMGLDPDGSSGGTTITDTSGNSGPVSLLPAGPGEPVDPGFPNGGTNYADGTTFYDPDTGNNYIVQNNQWQATSNDYLGVSPYLLGVGLVALTVATDGLDLPFLALGDAGVEAATAGEAGEAAAEGAGSFQSEAISRAEAQG